MPLATKNNAIIVKDGKVAENCGCCDKCSFAAVPQSIELDITATGGGLYAATTYKDRKYIPFFGNLGEVISVAKSYYARPVQSGTYSLALQSVDSQYPPGPVATYAYSNASFYMNCAVNLTSSSALGSLTGAGIGFFFGGINVAVFFDTGGPNDTMQVKTQQEMSDMLDTLFASGPTSKLYFFETAVRNQERESIYNPYATARYRCTSSNTADVSFFNPQDNGQATANTLFPVSWSTRRSEAVFASTSTGVLNNPYGSAYLLYQSFVGDWQIQSSIGPEISYYHATFSIQRTMSVTQGRAIFSDGTTKILPFG